MIVKGMTVEKYSLCLGLCLNPFILLVNILLNSHSPQHSTKIPNSAIIFIFPFYLSIAITLVLVGGLSLKQLLVRKFSVHVMFRLINNFFLSPVSLNPTRLCLWFNSNFFSFHFYRSMSLYFERYFMDIETWLKGILFSNKLEFFAVEGDFYESNNFCAWME